MDGDGGDDSRRTTAALVVAVVAFAVQQTAIVPAVHDVQVSLHSSHEWASWLVTVYLMVATVATPALGRLADLHGRRRMLLLGLWLFALASVGAALAPDMAVLIVFRALQGAGGAVYPLALALARDHVPPERSSRSISLLTGAFGVGTALGFVAGGLLAEYVSWRAVFGLGAVLVVVATVTVARTVSDERERASGGFDGVGTVVLAVSTISLLAALTLVVSLGWTSPVSIGLFVVTAGAAAFWVAHERRTEDPLVDVHVLTLGPVAVVNVATVGLGWCLFASYLLIPELARSGGPGYGLGASTFAVGLLMLPLALGQTICSTAAGSLGSVSPRLLLSAGLFLLAAGTGLLSTVEHSVAAVAGGALLLGMGAGFGLQSSSATVTQAVEGDVAAVSAAVNSTVRRLAGGIGGQTSTLLLASLVVAGSTQPRFAAYRASYVVAAALSLLGGLLVVAVRPDTAGG